MARKAPSLNPDDLWVPPPVLKKRTIEDEWIERMERQAPEIDRAQDEFFKELRRRKAAGKE